jgi:hypothetical protein
VLPDEISGQYDQQNKDAKDLKLDPLRAIAIDLLAILVSVSPGFGILVASENR